MSLAVFQLLVAHKNCHGTYLFNSAVIHCIGNLSLQMSLQCL